MHTKDTPLIRLKSDSVYTRASSVDKITLKLFYGAQVFSLPVKSRTKDPRPGIAQLITYTFLSSLLLYNSAALAL